MATVIDAQTLGDGATAEVRKSERTDRDFQRERDLRIQIADGQGGTISLTYAQAQRLTVTLAWWGFPAQE